MKKTLLLAGILSIALIARFADVASLRRTVGLESAIRSNSVDVFASAFAEGRGNFVVEGSGTVTRILTDDNEGSRHQRFIVKLATGQTLLLAHKIDLASRVENLAVGDTVDFKGEYEWNDRGGVMHWTHRDPAGRHEAGWIKHNGKIYQ